VGAAVPPTTTSHVRRFEIFDPASKSDTTNNYV